MADKLRLKKYPQNGNACTGDLVQQLRTRPYSNPSYWMLEAADEIERLRAELAEVRGEAVSLRKECSDSFLSGRGSCHSTIAKQQAEIDCLRSLVIRAWHSFRSGLSFDSGCDCGLTDADILELVRLSKSTGDTMSPSAGGEQSHG